MKYSSVACNGGGKDASKKCCSIDFQCDEGQGSCENDEHCRGYLRCGRNNCNQTAFLWDKARCCEGNYNLKLLNTDLITFNRIYLNRIS